MRCSTISNISLVPDGRTNGFVFKFKNGNTSRAARSQDPRHRYRPRPRAIVHRVVMDVSSVSFLEGGSLFEQEYNVEFHGYFATNEKSCGNIVKATICRES